MLKNMPRTLIEQTINQIGQKVQVAGWINSKRDHGQMVFIDLRDKSGILQIVAGKNQAQDLREEDVVCVQGQIKNRPPQMENPDIQTGKIELEAEKITVLSKAATLPFALKDVPSLSLPVLLDFRPLTLRSERVKAILTIQEVVIDSFRQTMKRLGFFEFQAPAIVPTATEGGAEVFKIDYYGHNAYLAQSPQMYKQIMVGAFERVFTVTKAYRAEPSYTTRHLSEYVSLDAEMGFIDSWEDLMAVCEIVIRDMWSALEQKCSKELSLFGVTLPILSNNPLPKIKMRQAQEIIFQRTGRDNRNEPDLTPEDEKEICLWSKENYHSDIIFITHYPRSKRPFYTQEDPSDPQYTLSFDILCAGLEITTGGQRINDYQKLLQNIKEWGNTPNDFRFYLQAFQYGMPPEGGFAFGAERLVKQILQLENLREANAFPRDMGRIDNRLNG